MKRSLDWADVRLFLAVLDGGNLVTAADQLEISQPTAGRRLSALERSLGAPLFVRTGRRMVPTDAAKAIIDSARQMEREALAIQRAVDGQAQGLCGEVTISATEGTGSEWLIPVLRSLRRRYPEISIVLQIETRSVDLVQREADIALRMGRPTQLDLIVRRLATIGFGFYAAASYLADWPAINSLEQLSGADWIRGQFGTAGSDLLLSLLYENGIDHRIVLTTNSPAAQIAAVREGLGVAVLSHRWASMHPELVRLLPQQDAAAIDLWLVTHEDLRHSARIKAVSDHIAEHAIADVALFADGAGSGGKSGPGAAPAA